MLKLLQELCALPGVSSREKAVRDYLCTQAEPYASSIRTDPFGNLIVFKKGQKSTGNALLLDAPMDEVGVMISGYTEDGSLRFQCVGGIDRRTLIGKRIYLGERCIPGVFGMKPIHLTSREERKSLPKEKELYIDIGCSKKEEAQMLVPLGEVGVFASDCGSFGNGLFRGKGAGNRAACGILLQLIKDELPCDCTFVFSAQREVGARGAFGSAFSVKPEIVLALDSCAAWDFPGVSEADCVSRIGKGAVLPLYDQRTAYDRTLFEKLRTLAENSQIAWQMQEGKGPLGNAGVYRTRASGTRAAGIALPVRYRHGPAEVISLRDAEQVLNLSRAFLSAMADEMEEKGC